MKKRSLIFFILLAALIGAAFIIYAKWNKPHENVEDLPGTKITAAELFRAFAENEQQATKTYNGKVIEVTGVVTAIETNQEGKTIVQLQSNDETVTIKGVCSGFTTDVILIRCYLIKQ
jgi:DNA/RNA endonuclease YhcR with UshA esterase domain